MKLFRDIFLLLVTAVALLWGVVGCGSIIYDDYPVEESGSETELVTLVLNVGMVAESRAGADNPRESMHDLRIVLLDASGKVEYNEYIPLTGVERYGEKIIRTVPGEKKIFLIANEKSLSSVKMTGSDQEQSLSKIMESDAAKVGAANFEALAEAIYFTPGDYGQMNIPLSSSYEFEIPVGAKRIERTFYLVHAATKFEFKFINERESTVRIDALSISSLAEDMYLMANFGKETPATQKTVSWKQNGTDRTEYWIDWLKAVSDATTSNPADPDNERVNGIYGWISDYELPPTEQNKEHKTRHLIADENVDENPVIAKTYDIPVASAETPSVTLPTVYFPESKYIPASGRQEYRFSVTLTDMDSKTSNEFKDIKLNYIGSQDNLVTLFRNTHVKVTCTVGYEARQMSLTLLIGICPWNYEEIDIPTFD